MKYPNSRLNPYIVLLLLLLLLFILFTAVVFLIKNPAF